MTMTLTMTLTIKLMYSRVKVPKLEDLLVEEWSLARPNQAGISAWTLNTYIRQIYANSSLETILKIYIIK